jgi:hypothetical protein
MQLRAACSAGTGRPSRSLVGHGTVVGQVTFWAHLRVWWLVGAKSRRLGSYPSRVVRAWTGMIAIRWIPLQGHAGVLFADPSNILGGIQLEKP